MTLKISACQALETSYFLQLRMETQRRSRKFCLTTKNWWTWKRQVTGKWPVHWLRHAGQVGQETSWIYQLFLNISQNEFYYSCMHVGLDRPNKFFNIIIDRSIIFLDMPDRSAANRLANTDHIFLLRGGKKFMLL